MDFLFGRSSATFNLQKQDIACHVLERDSLNIHSAHFNKISQLSQAIFYASRQNRHDLTNDRFIYRILFLQEITQAKVYPKRVWYWHIATLGLSYVCLTLFDRYRANKILEAKESLLREYTHRIFNPYLLESSPNLCRVLEPLDPERQLAILRCASANGINLNERYSGKTLLSYTSEFNHPRLLQALLAAGARLDITDTDGETALIKAIRFCQQDHLTRILPFARAYLETPNRTGRTALMHASMHHPSFVQPLIAAGANPDTKTPREGYTSLMLAALKNHPEGAAALIQAGANLNIQDHTGKTALMHAVLSDHFEIAHLLISAGADLNVQDRAGNTVEMLAQRQGDGFLFKETLCRNIDISNIESVKKISKPLLMKKLCHQTDQSSNLMKVLLQNEDPEKLEEFLEFFNKIDFTPTEARQLLYAIDRATLPASESVTHLLTFLSFICTAQINPLHFGRRIIGDRPMQEVPISLHAVMSELCRDPHFLTTLPPELQDDHRRVSKEEVIRSLLARFADLDRNSLQNSYGEFSSQQIRLVKITLSNLVDCFRSKKQALYAIESPQERLSQTNTYHYELRDVVINLGIAFRHCSNRISENVEKYYWKYVNSDIDLATASQEAKTIENRVLKSLLLWRESLFEVAVNGLEANEHLASTVKYLKEALTGEFGLRSSGLLELDHRFAACAQKEMLAPVREKLQAAYTPLAIIRHLDGLMTSHQGRFYKDYKKWHKNYSRDFGYEFNEGDLWNEAQTHMSVEKLSLFARYLGVLVVPSLPVEGSRLPQPPFNQPNDPPLLRSRARPNCTVS